MMDPAEEMMDWVIMSGAEGGNERGTSGVDWFELSIGRGICRPLGTHL